MKKVLSLAVLMLLSQDGSSGVQGLRVVQEPVQQLAEKNPFLNQAQNEARHKATGDIQKAMKAMMKTGNKAQEQCKWPPVKTQEDKKADKKEDKKEDKKDDKKDSAKAQIDAKQNSKAQTPAVKKDDKKDKPNTTDVKKDQAKPKTTEVRQKDLKGASFVQVKDDDTTTTTTTTTTTSDKKPKQTETREQDQVAESLAQKPVPQVESKKKYSASECKEAESSNEKSEMIEHIVNWCKTQKKHDDEAKANDDAQKKDDDGFIQLNKQEAKPVPQVESKKKYSASECKEAESSNEKSEMIEHIVNWCKTQKKHDDQAKANDDAQKKDDDGN